MTSSLPRADPGFPIGGGANPHWRGHQPLTQALFGENIYTICKICKTICKNKRIWSCWGGGGARRKLLYVDLPLTAIDDVTVATDGVIHIICTLLPHHNTSCYGIMTSHIKMSAITKDLCDTSNKYCRI